MTHHDDVPPVVVGRVRKGSTIRGQIEREIVEAEAERQLEDFKERLLSEGKAGIAKALVDEGYDEDDAWPTAERLIDSAIAAAESGGDQ